MSLPASNQNRRPTPVFLAPGMDVSSFWIRILSDLKLMCFLFKIRHKISEFSLEAPKGKPVDQTKVVFLRSRELLPPRG